MNNKLDAKKLIYKSLYKHRIGILFVLAITGLRTLASLFQTILFEKFTDRVLVNGDLSFGKIVILLMVLLSIIEGISAVVEGRTVSQASNTMVFSTRAKLIKHILRLPFMKFDKWKISTLVNRIKNCGSLGRISVDFVAELFSEIVIIVFIIGYLMKLNWVLGLIAVIGAIFSSIMEYSAGHHAYYYKKLILKEEEKLDSHILNSLRNMTMIRLWNATSWVIREVEQTQDKIIRLSLKHQERVGVTSGIGRLSFDIARLTVWAIAAIYVVRGELTIGQFFVFNSYLGWLDNAFGVSWRMHRRYYEALTGVERVTEIFEIETEDISNNGEERFPENFNIKIQNVSFKYDDERGYILKNIKLQLNAGSAIALVGTSGAGKSTLLRLLLRMYPPSEGNIKIGNSNISNIQYSSLLDNIGYVQQDISLLTGTIRDNLLIANPEATEEEIWEALNVSEIAGMVNALPKKLDTDVGDVGDSFSQGEKQRIAIAQCILRSPKVMLLDEATSALDEETQSKVIQNLKNWSRNRILIMVAHRLNSIRNFEQIVVLQNGEIIETGKHDQLMKNNGLYFKLYSSQSELDDVV